MNGKLIVLEGLDGSGKSTQFERLQQTLTNAEQCRFISFPDYAEPSSALVKMYLNGEFGRKPQDVNAYAASSFYAVDRYACYKKMWQTDFEQGHHIIAARYTTSNAIYQMTKLPQTEWPTFLQWLESYEYGLLGLPKPDLVIFLDMPPEISQRLMSERYQGDETKKDIHESNLRFLEQCRKTARFAADFCGWKWISCAKENEPRSIAEIGAELKSEIECVIGGTK